ncbi:MAG: LysM peptidoglycan-binding domain-containing protein [Cytophagales bacterium]|nr:LysM peptidoglycan-binding domain-containing protein [Cytophagales bacterium]MDW8384889.1 LysM peptidoglycan-binding domain-containing protein [Flammeovirgaceae bacterium]
MSQIHVVVRGETASQIAKKYQLSVERLLALNGLSSQATLFPGQQLIVSEPKKPKSAFSQQTYVVQRGDTLVGIARKFNLSLLRLLELNNLPDDATLAVGQTLIVSELPKVQENGMETVFYEVMRGDTLTSISRKFNIPVEEIRQLNRLSEEATLFQGQKLRIRSTPLQEINLENTELPDLVVYTVKEGDFLAKIAEQFFIDTKTLCQYNRLEERTPLEIGQKLWIPQNGNYPPIPSSEITTANIIRKFRKYLDVEILDGKKIFRLGLNAPVGKGQERMFLADIEKVQKRLVDLELLSPNVETPAELFSKLGNQPITASSIPQTIAAIERFQQLYCRYWAERPERMALLECSHYTPGVVATHDLTFKLMRELTHYTLTLPHPVEEDKEIIAKFRNFVPSPFTVYPYGISYVGSSKPVFSPELQKKLQLDDNLMKTLLKISSHEGNLDALNTYDKAFLSFGFIQFAGSAVNGPLAQLLARMKHEFPEAFDDCFGIYGIDVEYKIRSGQIQNPVITFFNLYAKNGKYRLQGVEAEKAIRDDVEALSAFIIAGHHPDLIAVQLQEAIRNYMIPALNIRFDVNLPSLQLKNILLTDVIRSPAARAVIIDLTVNQWTHRVRQMFSDAIHQLASELNVKNYQELCQLDERRIIQTIIKNNAHDMRIVRRGNSMLNSDLSLEKQPFTPDELAAYHARINFTS